MTAPTPPPRDPSAPAASKTDEAESSISREDSPGTGENSVHRPPNWVLPVVIGLLSTVWGSTYFVIREGLHDLPPFTSAAVRFCLASAVMAVLCAMLSKKEGGTRPTFSLVLVMGLGNFGICYGLVYWSETTLPSGMVSVLWATFPMLVAAVGLYGTRREPLRPAQWVGFGVGFLGVLLLFSTDVWALGAASVITALITLLGPMVGALGQTWVKRFGEGVSSLQLNRDGMIVGAAFLAVLAATTEDFGDARWTPRAVGSVVYLALAGTVLTFGLYYWALRWWDSYRMSIIAYLTPVLALTLGTLAGGEPLGWGTVAGTGLVLGGVGLVLRRSR